MSSHHLICVCFWDTYVHAGKKIQNAEKYAQPCCIFSSRRRRRRVVQDRRSMRRTCRRSDEWRAAPCVFRAGATLPPPPTSQIRTSAFASAKPRESRSCSTSKSIRVPRWSVPRWRSPRRARPRCMGSRERGQVGADKHPRQGA